MRRVAKMVPCFLLGRQRHLDEPGVVPWPEPAESFGNQRRRRSAGLPDLTAQVLFSLPRRPPRDSQNTEFEFRGKLPADKIFHASSTSHAH
jgi:hypothetical protein